MDDGTVEYLFRFVPCVPLGRDAGERIGSVGFRVRAAEQLGCDWTNRRRVGTVPAQVSLQIETLGSWVCIQSAPPASLALLPFWAEVSAPFGSEPGK